MTATYAFAIKSWADTDERPLTLTFATIEKVAHAEAKVFWGARGFKIVSIETTGRGAETVAYVSTRALEQVAG